MRDKNFDTEFDLYLNLMKSGENFSFTRFSDGEMYMLQGKSILLGQNRDNKQYTIKSPQHPVYDEKSFIPERDSEFLSKLNESFLYEADNYYKGISCKCCVGVENFNWQLEKLGGDNDHLSWANALINSNYPRFMHEMYPIIQKRGAVVVCNEMANLSQLDWVINDFRIRNNSFADLSQIEPIRNYIKDNNIENTLFLFSASAFSNVAQYELYKEFPNNTYIDIGTSLSYQFQIPSRRGYLHNFYHRAYNKLRRCVWN